MTSALIGYTGFVGSTLLRLGKYDNLYNSSNIDQIQGKQFDYVVCSAAPAEKWKANMNPEADWRNIEHLIKNIKQLKSNTFVLISTVDVYSNPVNVDESTEIDSAELEPYGKHRFYLEQIIADQFSNYIIIRLPGLFGSGLKKNFIYDLIHNNHLGYTNLESRFQFYNIGNIHADIQLVQNNNINLLNIASEPISAREVVDKCGIDAFENKSLRNPSNYNMKSKYSYLHERSDGYMYSKNFILDEIKSFYDSEKRKEIT